MRKFLLGEVVIVVAYRGGRDWWNALAGQEVTILRDDGPRGQYKVTLPFPSPMLPAPEYWCHTPEESLRKRPDDKPFTAWFRGHIIVDPIQQPLTEPLAREQLKGILQPFDNFYEGYD